VSPAVAPHEQPATTPLADSLAPKVIKRHPAWLSRAGLAHPAGKSAAKTVAPVGLFMRPLLVKCGKWVMAKEPLRHPHDTRRRAGRGITLRATTVKFANPATP
jgi:hypothetical protein